MKIKLLILFSLALMSLYYNLKDSNIIEYFNVIDFNTLIYSHLGIKTSDSYLGVLLDFFIIIFFFINIKDINTYFKIFGG